MTTEETLTDNEDIEVVKDATSLVQSSIQVETAGKKSIEG